MFGYRRREDRERTSALAARQAVCEAGHPRVSEPTARSVLAGLGRGDLAALGEDATVLDALRVMAERNSSAVAVTTPAGLVGIFSERDYARGGVAGNGAASHTPVVDVMARPAPGVAATDSVRRCLALMNERQVTHAAVLDAGRPVGLLSEVDLLRAQVAYHERVFHETELDQKLLNLRGTYSC